jgi:hypothetical protein
MQIKAILYAALLLSNGLLTVNGQTKTWLGDTKLSGYFIGRHQATIKSGDNSNAFDLRMARMSLGGRIMENFEWKIQGQITGNTTTLAKSPRLVDLFVEWQKYKYIKVKAGQFKRPFTFENPMNPIDQGFMGYGQVVSKLSGSSDRTGEHSSNGRDIGIQVQGDFLKNHNDRELLHYQIGIFNGQGINTGDVDNKKDIIGGIWIMPMKEVRIGVFGWNGSHARNTGSEIISLQQHRYALSAEYKNEDWQIRAEYIHSTGLGFAKKYETNEDLKNASIKYYNDEAGNPSVDASNKADGFYALCIAPLIKQKLRIKARYDLYRQDATWEKSRTQYEAGINYLFNKNLEIQTEYVFVNDRTDTKQNYSMIDVELCVRF